MPNQKSLNGEVNLIGMTNSQLGAVSGIIQGGFGKKLTGFSARIQGTIRQAGNAKTATYYMENTGMQEKNFSGTLAYQKIWYGGEIYYSQFNTKLGIFSGSQVATVSDMEMAIQQPKPITPSYFSYSIGRPYQTVTHDLFKASAYLKLKQYGKLNITFASQQNVRSEYDYISFNGSLNPALYLSISTQTVDAIWSHSWFKNMTGSLGVNYMTQGNVRLYEFLIPNFRNYCGGIFLQEKWEKGRWILEGGIRGDYRWLRVYTLDLNTAQVITPTYNFHNATGSIGATFRLNQSISLLGNIGTAWKAPTVNELYSNGVHQSAAAWETGNPNLVPEQSYNINASIKYSKKKFKGEIELYNHWINHYTYLKPDLTFIQTVRGSYPEFTYTQVYAVFRGTDITLQYELLKGLTLTSKTALIFSYNYTINNYLILTPSNRFENSLKYQIDKVGKLTNLYVSISNLSVPTQTRVPSNSDYLPPPQGYDLWGADLGFDIPAGKQFISINFGVTNLTNVAYRDYLNRFRYFTNDLGRNMSLRIKIPFELLKPK
jgi:iron complex outermembrane receptor protein